MALRILGSDSKLGEKGVAPKVGDNAAALHLNPLHAPGHTVLQDQIGTCRALSLFLGKTSKSCSSQFLKEFSFKSLQVEVPTMDQETGKMFLDGENVDKLSSFSLL